MQVYSLKQLGLLKVCELKSEISFLSLFPLRMEIPKKKLLYHIIRRICVQIGKSKSSCRKNILVIVGEHTVSSHHP